ncbi:MAG: heimdallarchaeosortase [Candidatus Heimdallarchaeaceae archaeon]
MSHKINNEQTILRSLHNLEGRNKHIYSILSFIVVIVLTLIFYLLPDYYFLEEITSDVAFQILRLYDFDVKYDGLFIETGPEDNSFLQGIINFFSSFDAHGGKSPVIKALTVNKRFAIVRACTGMQAGALLMALIIVTPAKSWNKVKATAYVIVTLVITNFLRISLIIGMTVTLMTNYGVTYEGAWMWSHDVLGKPIGFFGTILFAFIIEGQNVPILNTVSLWIDSLLDLFSKKK